AIGCQQLLCRKRPAKQLIVAQLQRAIENGRRMQRRGSPRGMFRLTQFQLQACAPASSRESLSGELQSLTTEFCGSSRRSARNYGLPRTCSMGWSPSPAVERRKPVSFTMKYQTGSPMLRFSSEPGTLGAEILHSVTSQPSWPSLLLTFARQEKLPEPLTSFADRWRNNIACSSSRLSVFTRQSRHDPG